MLGRSAFLCAFRSNTVKAGEKTCGLVVHLSMPDDVAMSCNA